MALDHAGPVGAPEPVRGPSAPTTKSRRLGQRRAQAEAGHGGDQGCGTVMTTAIHGTLSRATKGAGWTARRVGLETAPRRRLKPTRGNGLTNKLIQYPGYGALC